MHVGSVRGLAIHGLVSEALSELGVANEFMWEHNDFDPFDTVQSYLDQEKFIPHLGKPLYLVPSPEPGFDNFAQYFGAEFVKVHQKLGFTPRYYWAYADLYKAGKMDACMRTALTRASDVRRILKDVSGSVKDETWLPVCGGMRELPENHDDTRVRLRRRDRRVHLREVPGRLRPVRPTPGASRRSAGMRSCLEGGLGGQVGRARR